MDDVWAMVHAERTALIDDLEILDGQSWEARSLCTDWTVHDVVAHLVHGSKLTRSGAVAGYIRAGLDFDRQISMGVKRNRQASPQATLALFGRVALRRSTTPAPVDTRLVEIIVHGEDIRRPLGLVHSYPRDAVVRALRSQARTAVAHGGARELLTRVRLAAEDADVALGRGPTVSGSTLALLLAVSGRPVSGAHLDGPGLAALTKALSH